MHPAASGRQDADPPVAELVAHAFDDHGRGVGKRSGRRHLVAQVLQEVFRRAGIEIVFARQPVEGRRRRHTHQVVHQASNREAELERATGSIAFPERHLARLAGRRRHEHAIVRDLLDAPRRGAEHERLAGAALEHHLLVQFADAGGARSGAEQKHAVQPAIRNRPAVGDRHALGAFARRQRAGDSVPGDARAQLREFVGRVTSREHVEHALEDGAAQLRERRRAPDRAKQLLDFPVVHRRHRHDLLRDDVERVPGKARGLDRAIVHRLGDRRAGDEIAAKFREHDPLADGVRVVAAAADALKPAGH